MGSEDFSFMLERRPGAYIAVGNGGTPFCHNPSYDFNDAILPLGASLYARARGAKTCLRLRAVPRCCHVPAPHSGVTAGFQITHEILPRALSTRADWSQPSPSARPSSRRGAAPPGGGFQPLRIDLQRDSLVAKHLDFIDGLRLCQCAACAVISGKSWKRLL
jgi:hypothetical protein